MGIEAYSAPIRVPKIADILIMDAPSRTHDEQLVSLLKRTETAIIPVVPSPMDIRADKDFSESSNP